MLRSIKLVGNLSFLGPGKSDFPCKLRVIEDLGCKLLLKSVHFCTVNTSSSVGEEGSEAGIMVVWKKVVWKTAVW